MLLAFRFVFLDMDCQRVGVFKYSGVCYNARSYNERKLQRRDFISKIRILQRVRRNNIGRRSTRMRISFRAFPLSFQSQLLCLLSFVIFSYQFSSVVCLFAPFVMESSIIVFAWEKYLMPFIYVRMFRESVFLGFT